MKRSTISKTFEIQFIIHHQKAKGRSFRQSVEWDNTPASSGASRQMGSNRQVAKTAVIKLAAPNATMTLNPLGGNVINRVSAIAANRTVLRNCMAETMRTLRSAVKSVTK